MARFFSTTRRSAQAYFGPIRHTGKKTMGLVLRTDGGGLLVWGVGLGRWWGGGGSTKEPRGREKKAPIFLSFESAVTTPLVFFTQGGG